MTQVIEKKKAFTKTQCKAIYVEAYEAGLIAGKEVGVPKFIVGSAIGLSDAIDFRCRREPMPHCIHALTWRKIAPKPEKSVRRAY